MSANGLPWSHTTSAGVPLGPAALHGAERRIDGEGKVTGQAAFAADRAVDGMLVAAVLPSAVAHARLVHVDTSRARQVPGVHAVLTGDDVRPARFGRRLLDRPVLAWDRVRFAGEPVAAVAAETPEAAREAIRLIDVRYEELPEIRTAEEALRDGAVVLHENPTEYRYLGGERPPILHPNLQGYDSEQSSPDDEIEAAFRGAAHVVEHTFTTPRQHHGYLEPRAALARIDDAGLVHIISTNKAPAALRRQLALTAGVPAAQVVIDTRHVGGDFGGKGFSVDEYLCYYLARASGRPVKAVRSYAEDLWGTNHRHAATIRMRTAVSADGRFLAHHSEFLLDGGAYAAAKPSATLTVGGPTRTTMAAYRIEHAKVEVKVAYTNAVPSGHMRAPGHVQANFAAESHIDMIARELGIDPLELRMRNAVRGSDHGPLGQHYGRPRAVEVLELLREAGEDLGRGPGTGRGIALDVGHVGSGQAAHVVLDLRADGGVDVTTTLADQGGGAHTMVGRVVAAALECDPDRVVVAETLDPGPDDTYLDVGGSRVTHVLSRAAHDAATSFKERLEELACKELGLPTGGLTLAGEQFTSRSTGLPVGSLPSLAPALVGTGLARAEGDHDGSPAPHDVSHDFCGCLVTVEVDPETGEVTVQDAVLVVDVGTILNPTAHQGQIEGGFVYGLGAALSEDLPDPAPAAPIGTGLAGYQVPTILEVPRLRTILLPAEEGPGAFGAAAIGELTNSLVPAAVANAVADAVGARVTSLPITGERVLASLADRTPAR